MTLFLDGLLKNYFNFYMFTFLEAFINSVQTKENLGSNVAKTFSSLCREIEKGNATDKEMMYVNVIKNNNLINGKNE